MKKPLAISLAFLVLLIFTLIPSFQLKAQLGQLSASRPDFGSRFTNFLPIPPILDDKNPDPRVADFELRVQKSITSFFEGQYTETYGYNGNYLGPAIRVRKGDKVNIAVKNLLDEETTVHWHGLLVPGEMDGGPHYPFGPGEKWKVNFTINQPAATLWYHPHPHGKIGKQVYKGLAGVFIIDDENSENLNIPKDYGVDDIPLIIQDKRFASDGTLLYKTQMMDVMHGMLGDTILVNGTINSVLEVGTHKIRFRIINGSNARVYRLGLSDGSAFFQIASDGGFLESPLEMRSLVLSPGERAEIIVDFSKYKVGETILLESPEFQILKFVVKSKVADETFLPEKLTTISAMAQYTGIKTRKFVLAGMGPTVTINGKKFDIKRIDEFVTLEDTEIWEIRNVGMDMGHRMMHRGMTRGMMGGRMRQGMMQGGMAHPFHIHGVQFRVLDRDGNKPPANERGWKDTVLAYPEETVRVIARFSYKGIYVYHCHILEHDDAGMMGTFEVK